MHITYLVTRLFPMFSSAIKVTLLFYNRRKFGKMLKLFHKEPFVPDVGRGGPKEEYYLRRTIRTTEIQLVVYFLVVSVTVNSGGIVFLKSRLFDSKDHWKYPFVPITVVNTKNSPMFELACIYQYTCVLLYAAIIATIYVLLSTIMAHLSIQFKILINAFRTIRDRARKMHEDEGKIRSEGFYMSKILGDYIEHHLKVFQLAKDLEELINIMILVVMLASVILLCFLLYQASLHPLGSVPFIQNFFYYWIIVCQVSMYCYWGNEATLQAANVASAVAEADWPGAPIPVSKALVLIIARSQKPVYMTIGKFVPLSMNTLMSILKGSFSYFMVLRQTQNEGDGA